MSATVKDVARYAGVSVATVSKYMNGGNLREKYRVQVEKAVKELNYSVNAVARTLKTNRTRMVGILTPDITSSFVSDIIQTVQITLMEKGYIPLILDCQLSAENEKKQLEALLRWQVDGIILFPGFNEVDLCREIQGKNIPLVIVDQVIKGLEADCIVSNNYESAFRMTEKLIEAGHTNIALCRGNSGTYSADERARGHEDAMQKHGLEVWMEDGKFTIAGGYAVTRHFLEAAEKPTAIMCCNYHMTIGMLRALTELGISFPGDVSVATFDKQEFDFALSTSISCVEQPKEKMGRFAAELIVKKIESETALKPSVHTFEAAIHITDSIARI